MLLVKPLKLLTLCSLLPLVMSVTVSTKYGEIEGFVAHYPNVSAPFSSSNKFLGVPYAAPPVGELRFKPPQSSKEWKPSVRPAKEHGAICMQGKINEFLTKLFVTNFSYSEDCLYLDIYTPNVTLSLPVMVYIHGGSYDTGTSVTFPGDILSLQGVVVVVIQYRLGSFGFFTTGDSAAPGNYGMLDQVEALKWVEENIENFGGDPSRVTLFGVSSGGASVSLHLLSPLSKGLFHGVIAESGVDLIPPAVQSISVSLNYGKELAEKLSCPTSDHKAMVDCIRDKKAADVEKASEAINFKFVDHLKWAPVVDKHFLYDTPLNLITDALEFMYTPWPDNNDTFALRSQLVNVLGDYMYFAPCQEVAAFQSQVAPVYMFEFAHRSKVSFGSEWMGVVHANNMMYDFGVPFLPSSPFKYDEADRNVSLFIMALYTNFAKTGNPTPQPVRGVTLEKFNSTHRAYLKVDVNPKMVASFYPRRMAFWNDYYPKL